MWNSEKAGNEKALEGTFKKHQITIVEYNTKEILRILNVNHWTTVQVTSCVTQSRR
jgi:hypothetical protein